MSSDDTSGEHSSYSYTDYFGIHPKYLRNNFPDKSSPQKKRRSEDRQPAPIQQLPAPPVVVEKLRARTPPSSKKKDKRIEAGIVQELRKIQDKIDTSRTAINLDMDYNNDAPDKVREDLENARLRHQLLLDQQHHSRPQIETYVEDVDLRPRGDRFQQLMEMMLLQQTQSSNMIMNQMLLKTAVPCGVGLPVAHAPQCYQTPEQHCDCYHCHRHRHRHHEPDRRHTPVIQASKVSKGPGNMVNQRIIRNIALAAMFCKILDNEAREQKFCPSDEFVIQLQIREIRSQLHDQFLSAKKKFWKILNRYVISFTAHPFRVLVEKTFRGVETQEMKIAAQDLSYVIENLTYEMTKNMPHEGLLGDTMRSAVFSLLRNGRKFPPNFFLDIDLIIVNLDRYGKTVLVDDDQALVIVVNLFFMQGLIRTLLLQPYKFSILRAPSPTASENLNLLGGVYTYLYRLILTKIKQNEVNRSEKPKQIDLLPIPSQLTSTIRSDNDLQPLLRKVKKSLDYAEDIIWDWGRDYVKRLRRAMFVS